MSEYIYDNPALMGGEPIGKIYDGIEEEFMKRLTNTTLLKVAGEINKREAV